ncbi:MAG: PfkB family carbohydrate kinase [Lentisphaeria bacterium]
MPTPAAPSNSGLLVVGLNPAWQKTLFFDRLEIGEVNRATEVRTQASGKGINCLQAAGSAGGRAQLLQVAGGATGGWVTADLDRRSLHHVTVPIAGATRVCNTLLCRATGQMTELIEPSAPLTAAEAAQLAEQLAVLIPAAVGLALCGTFPPGVPPQFYATAAQLARARGIPVLLDGCHGVQPALETGIDLLKINTRELAALAGLPPDRPDAAATALFERYPRLGRLAVTAGPQAALLFDRTGVRRFQLPALDQVVNPIGAGDTVAGVLMTQVAARRHLFADSASPCPAAGDLPLDWLAAAFRDALACASASCLTAAPAAFDPAAARELAAAITLR